MNHHLLFDKYMVVSVLGTGTTGTVYLVKHQKLKVYRAMKKVKKAQSDMPSFQQEISFLKNLNHPGIPVLFDYEEDMEFYYLFEEYVEGISLDELVKQGRNFTETRLVWIGLQLCDILSYLHEQRPHPILYQDFKLEHVYLFKETIKLVDFGLAMFWDEHEKENKNFFGTNEFSAPEKIRKGEVGITTDIYGLGKVLWVLYRALPVESQNENLKEVILKAIHEDNKKRFCDMKEFKIALKDAVDGFEIKPMNDRQNVKYLDKQIAIGASQSRMGATHLSIALCSYFKKQGTQVHYKDMQKEFKEEMFFDYITGKEKTAQPKETLIKKFWPKRKQKARDTRLTVIDYGYPIEDVAEFLEVDLCMVLLGTRPWELEYTYRLCEKLQDAKNIIYICNWGNLLAAKQIGRKIGKKVYCFPLDEDPYKDSAKKDTFFSYVQQKEGW